MSDTSPALLERACVGIGAAPLHASERQFTRGVRRAPFGRRARFGLCRRARLRRRNLGAEIRDELIITPAVGGVRTPPPIEHFPFADL